jgi:peptidoglycan/LPS O-acetylase OafA/YrhL
MPLMRRMWRRFGAYPLWLRWWAGLNATLALALLLSAFVRDPRWSLVAFVTPPLLLVALTLILILSLSRLWGRRRYA